jgi:hypothetical protein
MRSRLTKMKNPASGLPVRGSGFVYPCPTLSNQNRILSPYRYAEPDQWQAQYLTDIDDVNGAGEGHMREVE